MEECFKQQCLTPNARDEITCTLVNVLFSRVPKPSCVDCDAMARILTLKHPCAKDDLGCGYVSVIMCDVFLYNCDCSNHGVTS